MKYRYLSCLCVPCLLALPASALPILPSTPIVFGSTLGDPLGEVFTINPDGSERTNISNRPGIHDIEPKFSWDGTHVVWYGGQGTQADIITARSDGSNPVNLTPPPNFSDNVVPNWAPDGSHLVYTIVGGEQLLKIPADGGAPVPLGLSGSWGDYSPSGNQLLYTRWASGSVGELHVYDFVTQVDTLLRQTPGFRDFRGTWSPDGSQIAFMSDVDGDFDIWTMRADGTDPRNVTGAAFVRPDGSHATESTPAWSPDGQFLAFNSNFMGNHDIYIMSAVAATLSDGSDFFQVTTNAADDWDPSWARRGVRPVPDSGVTVWFLLGFLVPAWWRLQSSRVRAST